MSQALIQECLKSPQLIKKKDSKIIIYDTLHTTKRQKNSTSQGAQWLQVEGTNEPEGQDQSDK